MLMKLTGNDFLDIDFSGTFLYQMSIRNTLTYLFINKVVLPNSILFSNLVRTKL